MQKVASGFTVLEKKNNVSDKPYRYTKVPRTYADKNHVWYLVLYDATVAKSTLVDYCTEFLQMINNSCKELQINFDANT